MTAHDDGRYTLHTDTDFGGVSPVELPDMPQITQDGFWAIQQLKRGAPVRRLGWGEGIYMPTLERLLSECTSGLQFNYDWVLHQPEGQTPTGVLMGAMSPDRTYRRESWTAGRFLFKDAWGAVRDDTGSLVTRLSDEDEKASDWKSDNLQTYIAYQ